MALIKCSDCGNKVSTDAKNCPKCGANVVLPVIKPKKTSPILKLVFWIVGIGCVFALYTNGKQQREAEDADKAQLAAMPEDQRSKVLADREKEKKAIAAKVAADEAKKAETEATLHDASMAETTCRMYAEKSANDPSSMDWIRDQREFSYISKDSRKALSIQPLRLKNAMGALVLRAVKCNLQKVGNDWQVTKMEEIK